MALIGQSAPRTVSFQRRPCCVAIFFDGILVHEAKTLADAQRWVKRYVENWDWSYEEAGRVETFYHKSITHSECSCDQGARSHIAS